ELKFRQCLETANRKIKTVYFLERGLALVVAVGSGEQRLAEVGVIGPEGMSGIALLLGADRSPNETFVQLEGTAQSITASDLRRVMAESSTLTSCLLRYAHVFAVQTGHNALANAKSTIEEGLARWLLMAHDRIDGDDVRITHDVLAQMLGSR